MAVQRQIHTFVVDGEPHTEDTFGEDKAKEIPYVVATAEGLKEEKVFGFTSEDALKLWAKENDLSEKHQKLDELQRRAQRSLSSHEESLVFRRQARIVNDATEHLQAALRKHDVPPNEIDRIADLIANYDPLEGPILHSLILWRHCNYGGDFRVIPGGVAVPDFRWIFFNDTASSAFHWDIASAHVLFQDTWFRGRRIYFFGVLRANCFVDYPWYFNDIASASIGF
jgi:hypothetical protein